MTALRQYLGVWQMPGGRVLLIVGILARLGIGMTPLALLLLVQRATGSYAAAGLAGGMYALAGAAISPVAGRVADRIGPSPVLLATSILHPLALGGLLLVSRGGEAALTGIFIVSALAGATYPPLTAAIRRAWTDATAVGSGRHGLRQAAMAAETSLFELVFVLGPMLVAALIVITRDPASALGFAAVATFAGTLWIARLPIMRNWVRHEDADATRGLGPLKVGGFPALLVCVAALGIAFGAAGVIVPAYAGQHGGGDGLGGVLLGVWGVGSAIGGIWFGTRRPAMALPRQFAWGLGAVSASFLVLAFMPGPLALGVALAVGGAAIAPALTIENNLVGRIAPAGMLNEAYTWVVTVSVAGSAAGGAVAGAIVDQPGGLPWAFVFAAVVLMVASLVAAVPTGPMARADERAAERLRAAMAAA
ncbi:MFS transporter [Actinoplanes friuliensis]|uniref:Putative MFS transporter n=1 Tax=Actinoplanes friuliensis DSM 7358 TaxID=1246995 RepID=U5VU47_9ACTN|nr:MFS transporter [Actinoplanes friuliensis]AGZ39146.1 putative MFS transporter [Actinoplanes friuliensis DSM 7358]